MNLKEFFKYIMVISLLSYTGSTYATQPYTGLYKVYGASHVIDTISVIHNNAVVKGEYLTILGNGHAIPQKPFIIVEGFDPLNNHDFETHLNLYNNYSSLVSDLHAQDYDVIILDFDSGADSIQRNAMLLVELIKRVYFANPVTGDNFVVMGYSMGGLVSRYALSWMEAHNQNHHTRLYISHDAPHKGANFPLGLQEFLQSLQTTSVTGIITSFLMLSLNNFYPAVKQMLVYHYQESYGGIARPHGEKYNFFSELYNLNPMENGYPSKPLKIAISNGNYQGTLQGIAIGDDILYFDYWKDNGQLCILSLWDLIWGLDGDCTDWADDHITATIKAGFDGNNPLYKYSLYSAGFHPIGSTNVKLLFGGEGEGFFSSNNFAYDIAPGSFSENYMNLIHNNIQNNITTTITSKNNACFIPTISALDLNIDLFSSFDPNNSGCYTMFDYIYANPNFNIDHFMLDGNAKNFILTHLNSSKTNSVKYYSETDIVIPSNTTVFGNENFKQSASNTIQNAGVFTVQSGATSTLTANQSITLNPGFTVEYGATFSASIENPACSEPVSFNPHYLATFPSNVNGNNNQDSTEFYTLYNCDNISIKDGYSPDSLYFNCADTIALLENLHNEIDSLLNEQIYIYPNPTSTGLVYMNISAELNLYYLQIKIYNPAGILISTNQYPQHGISTMSLNSGVGIYTIQFDFGNGTYIYDRKVIKF